jgi:hypothetical protein
MKKTIKKIRPLSYKITDVFQQAKETYSIMAEPTTYAKISTNTTAKPKL